MSMEDVLAKQKKAAKAAADLTKLKDDPKALLEQVAKVADQISDLAASANRLAASFAASGGTEERVLLTPDQRKRIEEATGVAMDMLVVQDADGSFASAMRTAKKPEIERLAAQQATVIATKIAREEAIEKLVKHLRTLDAPGVDEIIAAIRKDPTLAALTEQQKKAAEALQAQADAAAPPAG
jgi:hypothetical protein